MKRVLVAAALGGLLLVGTPTLASSAQRNDTKAEKGDAKGSDNKGGGKSDRGDRRGGDRGDRGDRGRYGHGYYRDGYYGGGWYYGSPYDCRYGQSAAYNCDPYGGGYYGGYGGGRYGYGGGSGSDAVYVQGKAFNPPEIFVGPGEEARWIFQDREAHTVTADNNSFDSGKKLNGEYRLRFDQPGTYSYHCAIHPEMKGRVVVQG